MLRGRKRRALTFGARMFIGLVWWELIIARLFGAPRAAAGRMDRIVALAVRFRALALRLGGVWIKLGQFISSRVDVVPQPVIDVLADLQDAVPSEPTQVMIARIEHELGKPVGELFTEFEPEPIAAASFGQVYRAELRSAAGARERVIIKVQRPNLDALVRTDLESLTTIIGWFKGYKTISARADLSALAREFGAGILAELNYADEAANAERFRKNFAGDPQVRVPRVFMQFVTPRVLVLENVEEIKITDYDGLQQAGINREAVAKKLMETYLQQFFVHGFFHADPHPGNLFVQPLDPASAQRSGVALPPAGRPFRLTFIDFGMVGDVPPAYELALREMIIGMGLKDARRVTEAMKRMNLFLPTADMYRVEQAVTAVFDKFWGMATTDLSNVEFDEMYSFVNQFRDLLKDLPFQAPQNMLYLGRAANILSGMTTALDAKFNPWKEVQPFAQGLAQASAKRPGLLDPRGVLNELLKLGQKSIALPNQADQFLNRALSGQLELRAQLSANSTNELRRIEGAVSGLTRALIVIGLLACGTALLLNGWGVLGGVLLVGGGLGALRGLIG